MHKHGLETNISTISNTSMEFKSLIRALNILNAPLHPGADMCKCKFLLVMTFNFGGSSVWLLFVGRL